MQETTVKLDSQTRNQFALTVITSFFNISKIQSQSHAQSSMTRIFVLCITTDDHLVNPRLLRKKIDCLQKFCLSVSACLINKVFDEHVLLKFSTIVTSNGYCK